MKERIAALTLILFLFSVVGVTAGIIVPQSRFGYAYFYQESDTHNSISNVPDDDGVCMSDDDSDSQGLKGYFEQGTVFLNGTGIVNTTLQFAPDRGHAFQNANDTHSADFSSDNTRAFAFSSERGLCWRLRLDFADVTNTVTSFKLLLESAE